MNSRITDTVPSICIGPSVDQNLEDLRIALADSLMKRRPKKEARGVHSLPGLNQTFHALYIPAVDCLGEAQLCVGRGGRDREDLFLGSEPDAPAQNRAWATVPVKSHIDHGAERHSVHSGIRDGLPGVSPYYSTDEDNRPLLTGDAITAQSPNTDHHSQTVWHRLDPSRH